MQHSVEHRTGTPDTLAYLPRAARNPRNLLLDHLLHDSASSWHQRPVEAGQLLWQGGQPCTDVCLPLDCVLAIGSELADGPAYVAPVLPGTAVGLFAVSDRAIPALTRATAVTDGVVACVSMATVRRAMATNAAARSALLVAGQRLFAEAVQGAACVQRHSMEQRFARWLLAIADCRGMRTVRITQYFTAELLGVRRSSMSVMYTRFAARGLIEHGRNRLRVLDVAGLEAAACECHARLRRTGCAADQAADVLATA